MLVRRDLITTGTFQRKVKATRDDWVDVAANIQMYLTPRRPSSQTGRPEVQFNDATVIEEQWYWCRPLIVNQDLRIGHRLKREDRIDLFIIQNDILGPVQQLILTIRERSR